LPLPGVPEAIEIHDVLLAACQMQAAGAATVMLPAPPALSNAAFATVTV
jgi:hypothetical protein